jgi:PIN domain nuclease of toxin-antitoxin system
LTVAVSARGNLLDTHTALFSMRQSHLLSPLAKAAVATGPNFLSVVCYWEVVIKSMKGKLDVGDPLTWWREALIQLVATPLVLRPDHVDAVFSLPSIHKDPFDRMLIAQATVESLALVSGDDKVARYASKSLKIIR